MKKLIIILSLILSATDGYAQSFKPVKVDSLVTVTLPRIFTKKDTLGQQTFSAKSSFGFIVVTRIANAKNNAPLKHEKDLTKVFKNYVKDVQQLGKGDIEDERDTTVTTLKGHLFTLQTDDGSGNIQYRRFLLLYTQEATYTFQYFYEAIRAAYTTDESKIFFSSIKLAPGLKRNDQYLAKGGSGMSSIKKTLIFGGGFVVILIIVFVAIRNRKRKAVA